MKYDNLFDAMETIPDRYIEEAAVKRARPRGGLKFGALAACLCLLVLGSAAGVRAYADPVSYVSVDVNPSLELCLNKWDRVVDVDAYNEDAEALCRNLELKNLTYEDALCRLLEDEAFRSYLDENADLTFTIVSEHQEELLEITNRCRTSLSVDSSVHCADYTYLHEAHDNHCSVGKYLAYRQLSEVDSETTLSDCMNMTMHEIHYSTTHHEESTNDHDANDDAVEHENDHTSTASGTGTSGTSVHHTESSHSSSGSSTSSTTSTPAASAPSTDAGCSSTTVSPDSGTHHSEKESNESNHDSEKEHH